MAGKSKLKVTPSSGNVFRDLGFSEEEAEHLVIRADLLIQIQKVVTARRLKQAPLAKLLQVSQPRVSDLLRGRLHLFQHRYADRHAGPSRGAGAARGEADPPAQGRLAVQAKNRAPGLREKVR